MPDKRHTTSASESENPAIPAPAPQATRPRTNKDWWPNQLDLSVLHAHSPHGNPLGKAFDYRKEFAKLDVEELRRDLLKLMTDSQPWWPADFGHYGPFFIRMSWHAAGTYRVADGRGGGGSGQQRFAPLNAWPDNANLDKARRLLWPVKQKHGQAISWADLLVFAGNVALESMGFRTFGFGFGREDVWEPEEIFWGPEGTWLGDERYSGDRQLAGPLAAVQMGLIYVNPEGPGGKPDVQAAARDIQETFKRMAMDDEETAALIVGGHTFGKAHGAHKADRLGPDPEAAPIENQGLGWINPHGQGHGPDTVTAGPEGAWTSQPTRWTHEYLQNLYGHEWELTASPAGTKQWRPKGGATRVKVPDAHIPGKHHAPMMFTTDLAMRLGPQYAPITQRWLDDPAALADAFARAWYKLLHRDMGPVSRYLGPWVAPPQPWQDPVPPVGHPLVTEDDVAALKRQVLAAGIPPADLVAAAWAAAATFRGTDKRGGANGGRVRLDPQRGWAVNEPAKLARTIQALERIQRDFASGGRRVSFADLVVLAGNAAIEKAASDAGHQVRVPFTPGRTDATQDMTDVESFGYLEPVADGFRNYLRPGLALSPETLLLERANLLTLTAPQMTVLVGGLRVLGANHGDTGHGAFTDRKGVLTNDFFVNLLDMGVAWRKTGDNAYEGVDRGTGARRWTATAVDLVFGAHSQLRALCEVYAAQDGEARFVADFVAAWAKVTNLDRYDVQGADGRPLAATR